MCTLEARGSFQGQKSEQILVQTNIKTKYDKDECYLKYKLPYFNYKLPLLTEDLHVNHRFRQFTRHWCYRGCQKLVLKERFCGAMTLVACFMESYTGLGRWTLPQWRKNFRSSICFMIWYEHIEEKIKKKTMTSNSQRDIARTFTLTETSCFDAHYIFRLMTYKPNWQNFMKLRSNVISLVAILIFVILNFLPPTIRSIKRADVSVLMILA
jgi:hypothetical protein